jgi:hypothetical protein
MQSVIEHAVLGTLTWNGDLDTWESKIALRPGCPIDIRLTTLMGSSPTENLDVLLRGGVDMIRWARRTEFACRQRIADDLLESYNDTWAPEGEAGSMSRSEFTKRLTPESLVLDIDGSGFFYWCDGDLFAGHYIVIRFDTDWSISEVCLAG